MEQLGFFDADRRLAAITAKGDPREMIGVRELPCGDRGGRQEGSPGASVYVASKHAVEGLTKSAALEAAASGVRVNAVAPGPVETKMLDRFTGSADRKAGLIAGVPVKRAGTPEEIAQTIVFLSSDRASFITGQSIAVDGGKLA